MPTVTRFVDVRDDILEAVHELVGGVPSKDWYCPADPILKKHFFRTYATRLEVCEVVLVGIRNAITKWESIRDRPETSPGSKIFCEQRLVWLHSKLGLWTAKLEAQKNEPIS